MACGASVQLNPHGIRFKLNDGYSVCRCPYEVDGVVVNDCQTNLCDNAQMHIYCTKENCLLGGSCGNSRRELPSLRLFKTKSAGTAVFTTHPIPAAVVVAEYYGVLEAFEGTVGDIINSVPLKWNSGYSMLLLERDAGGKFVCIEAKDQGGIARFMNHSCEPNTRFRQVQCRDQATIVVESVASIEAGEEVTVGYDRELWFNCQCGTPSCVNK